MRSFFRTLRSKKKKNCLFLKPILSVCAGEDRYLRRSVTRHLIFKALIVSYVYKDNWLPTLHCWIVLVLCWRHCTVYFTYLLFILFTNYTWCLQIKTIVYFSTSIGTLLDCVVCWHTTLAKAREQIDSKSITHTKYCYEVKETCKLCSTARIVWLSKLYFCWQMLFLEIFHPTLL